MNLIDIITDQPKQNLEIALDDGTIFTLNLRYVDNQQGWFYSLDYGTFKQNNRRIVTSPNMLRQFRNVLPFGLACIVSDGGEPVFIKDFLNSRASLYILNSADVVVAEGVMARND